MVDKVIIAQTPANINKPAPEFRKNDFEVAIFQKGYKVIHEQSLQCPCKSEATNQQSNCQNCGGTGWGFINATETKTILHSMNMSTKYKEWSQENSGLVNITVRDSEYLSFMDRITVVDGNSVFGEVKHFKKKNNVLFTYTSYNIKEILYIALFKGVSVKYQRLTETQDYTFEDNAIILNNKFLVAGEQDLSITVRYKHSPQYHVVDLTRDLMNSSITEGGKEKIITLPISAVGRQSHFVLTAENLSGTRLLDNSFVADACLTKTKNKNC